MHRISTPVRRKSAALLALLFLAAGSVWVVHALSPARTSSPVRDARPAADQDDPGGLTGTANPACTPARRFTALRRGLGPFCLPPDAIRAIDHPRFAPASSVRFLSPREPVLTLDLGGVPRAYPVRVLVWHEVVNDVVGTTPVAVTFCPLCNSGVAFDRRVQGRMLTFAVSGRLRSANLVMFDRETETLWEQLSGRAVQGAYEGTRLRMIPLQTVSFRDFRRSAPEGVVMTQRTGLGADYGRDPYAGYGVDREEPSVFLFGASVDPRLPPKARVLALLAGRRAAAVPYPVGPGPRRVVEVRLGGRRLVVLLSYGIGEPATAGSFTASRRGWAGAAFVPRIGGQVVSLVRAPRGFMDRRTGSIFDLTGRGVSDFSPDAPCRRCRRWTPFGSPGGASTHRAASSV